MSRRAEVRFAEIIETAIAEAEAVKCDLGDFVDGLRQMQEALNERVALAKDELSRGNR